MIPTDLVALLRRVQHACADTAFRIPRSEHLAPVSRKESRELAHELESLAVALRQFDPGTDAAGSWE